MNVLNSNLEDAKIYNCPKNVILQQNGECLRNDIVYQATVTSGEPLKRMSVLRRQASRQDLQITMRHLNLGSNTIGTQPSKHIWERDLDYAIKWKVLCKAPHCPSTPNLVDLSRIVPCLITFHTLFICFRGCPYVAHESN